MTVLRWNSNWGLSAPPTDIWEYVTLITTLLNESHFKNSNLHSNINVTVIVSDIWINTWRCFFCFSKNVHSFHSFIKVKSQSVSEIWIVLISLTVVRFWWFPDPGHMVPMMMMTLVEMKVVVTFREAAQLISGAVNDGGWWARSADVMLRAGRRLLRWDGNLQGFDMSDINMVHYAAALHLIHKRIREENCLECTKENWWWSEALRESDRRFTQSLVLCLWDENGLKVVPMGRFILISMKTESQ